MNTPIVQSGSPLIFTVLDPHLLRDFLIADGWDEQLLFTCHTGVARLSTADGACVVFCADSLLVYGNHIARTCTLLRPWIPQHEDEQGVLPC